MRQEAVRYPKLSVNYVDHHNPDLLLFDAGGQEMNRIDLTRLKTAANVHKLLNLLGVKETCGDDAPECAEWAKSGQCNANSAYMHASCRKSCGLCSANESVESTESCMNTSPDKDCEYWSTMGECDRNEAFMKSACARSCGECKVAERKRDDYDDDDYGSFKDEV